MTVALESKEKDSQNGAGAATQTTQLGVYRLVTEKRSFSPRQEWKNISRGFPSVVRLVKDVYTFSPLLFFLSMLVRIWEMGIQEIVSLHLSSRVLALIEDGLKKGKPDAAAIFQAVALNLMCSILTSTAGWCSSKLETKMSSGIDLMLQRRVLRSKLATDLTGVQANAHERVHSGNAWYTFRTLSGTLAQLGGAVGQLAYVLHTVRSSGHGPIFAAVCLLYPILDAATERSIWSEPHLIEATNPHYLRMKGLLALGNKKYKQDIITGDIVQHIIQELRKVIGLLGDTDITWAPFQYHRLKSTPLRLALKLFNDLPMLYYAVNAILNPTKFSLSTIATLQQVDSLLTWTFQDIFWRAQNYSQMVNKLKAVYDLEDVVHETKGGDEPYPPFGDAGEEHEKGMPLELSNVSFSYPGATAKALDNVSLSIKPGQLVVVVGANGSGKSTIVKLLTRLYEPTAGAITLGGTDMRAYRTADVRRATAALTQGHTLFPLSLGENIGLGNPARVQDVEMVKEAARLGGAAGLVGRLAEGYDAVLERPAGLQWGSDVNKDEKGALAEALKGMEKETDVSGGERQRLVASRTFMRFTTGTVKLVCVDEPSASLDPEGELQLFDNLRSVRAGKTMIFVTHRFAHLTQHADVVICMKDGSILESGTHRELMDLGGEYCKMYNIQAEAFESARPTVDATRT